MMTKPQVLLVGQGRETRLKEILQRRASLAEAGTVPDMVRLLETGAYDAVLCEQEVSDGTWREALQELQARRVSTPAIVVSQTSEADEGSRNGPRCSRRALLTCCWRHRRNILFSPYSNMQWSRARRGRCAKQDRIPRKPSLIDKSPSVSRNS